MEKTAGQTIAELTRTASEHGFTITKTQIRRWHLGGLLPRPKQHSLGRGAGTKTLYPPGTAAQLLKICEIHATERPLKHAAWKLWRAGYAVQPMAIRQFLNTVAVQWDRERKCLVNSRGDSLARSADRYISKGEKARLKVPALRRARKRAGSLWFPTLLRIMLEVAGGVFTGYGEYAVAEDASQDERTFVAGMGLKRASKDRIGTAEPWLQGGVEGNLHDLSDLLKAWSSEDSLAQASDEDLLWVRDQMNALIDGLQIVSHAMEQSFGRGAFGLAGIGDWILEATPQEEALMALFLLRLRTTEFESAVESLSSTIQNVIR